MSYKAATSKPRSTRARRSSRCRRWPWCAPACRLPTATCSRSSAASHSGEERHLAGARRILDPAVSTEDDLRNPADLPSTRPCGTPGSRPADAALPARAELLRQARGDAARLRAAGLVAGQLPRPGASAPAGDRRDRRGPDRAAASPVTVDGCGAPLFSVSLHGLARAAARIATAAAGTAEGRVATPCATHAEMASGTGRDVAALMRAVPGLLAKDGFEGVQVAALADGAGRRREDRRRRRPGPDAGDRCGLLARLPASTRPSCAPFAATPSRRRRNGRTCLPVRTRGMTLRHRSRATLPEAPTSPGKDHPVMTARRTAANTTCSATETSPPTPTGVCTPCAPRRTSPSPARRSPPTRT